MGQIVDAILKKRALDLAERDHNVATAQTIAEGFQKSLLFGLERRKTQAYIDNLVGEATRATKKLDIDERVANAQIAEAEAAAAEKRNRAGIFALGLRDLQAPAGTTELTGAASTPSINRLAARGLLSKEFGIPFEQLATPEERRATMQQKAEEAAAVDAAKPYTEPEAGLISKAEQMPTKIDELIALINENPVYQSQARQEASPTALERIGAANVQAFGEKGLINAGKRFVTKGTQRRAGILLKDLKVLAFGEGGKTLSENERMTALSLMDPSDKSEQEWIRGLEDAKAMLLRKAQLVTKRGELGKPKPAAGGGVDYKSKYGLE